MLSRCLLLLMLSIPMVGQTSAPATRNFHISGTVVNALSGQPLSHAQVAIGLALDPDIADSVVTGDDGAFDFADITPGKYWLMAEHHGFPRQAFNEHGQFSTAIVVGPGLQSEKLVFRLRPDASITGLITDDQNDPIRDAQVLLFRSGIETGGEIMTRSGQASTDDQGRYTFSHVRAGTYYLAVTAQPWYAVDAQRQKNSSDDQPSPLDVAYPVTFYPGSADESGASPIVVRAGDRAAADVSLTPVAALHLRLGSTSPQTTSVQASARVFGRFNIPVPSYNITSSDGSASYVDGLAPGRYVMQVDSYGRSRASTRQEVTLSDNTELAAAGEPADITISGLVTVRGDTDPPKGAFVRLLNRHTGEGIGARVNEKGEFETSSPLSPGKYQVYVFNAGQAVVGSVVAQGGAQATGRTLEITGKAPVHLAIELSRGLGRVDGTALRDNKAFAGAMIVLLPQDPENNAPLVRRDQSDSDGTFTLREVLPGKYMLLAIADGWDLEWLNPAVLKPYLKDAKSLDIEPNGKYKLNVRAQ